MRIISLYKKIGIYGIKNKINDNIYIGKTEMNFGDRRDSHYSLLNNNKHKNLHLQRAWNKYGKDNFEFVIIHELCDGEDINELEIKYISYYKDLNKCYNIAPGGEGGWNRGIPISDEVKKKIGEKNRIHMTGFVMPESTKKKISEHHKKEWEQMSDEERENKIKNFVGSRKGKKLDKNSLVYKKLLERERTKSNAAKYDIETVRKIRYLHEVENKGYTEISEMLEIPRGTIYNIATYRRWKYVS